MLIPSTKYLSQSMPNLLKRALGSSFVQPGCLNKRISPTGRLKQNHKLSLSSGPSSARPVLPVPTGCLLNNISSPRAIYIKVVCPPAIIAVATFLLLRKALQYKVFRNTFFQRNTDTLLIYILFSQLYSLRCTILNTSSWYSDFPIIAPRPQRWIANRSSPFQNTYPHCIFKMLALKNTFIFSGFVPSVSTAFATHNATAIGSVQPIAESPRLTKSIICFLSIQSWLCYINCYKCNEYTLYIHQILYSFNIKNH